MLKITFSAAINSAKGFLFGLKSALGSKMASTVTELKKEICDDEIYTQVETPHNQSKEAREIEQALEALSGEELTLEGNLELIICTS